MNHFRTDPGAITGESMRIISGELGEKALEFSPEDLAIVKRMIHTTADFEYADLYASAPGAIEAALKTILSGSFSIASDTNMIAAGVSRPLLEGLGGKIFCLVAEEETRLSASREGLTRSMISIRRSAATDPGAIYAIGNAPTALYELLRLAKEGAACPPLVIGVPVGFVEAAESKQALEKSGLPYITTCGRKGGSTVAVAIINALLFLAGTG